MYSEIHTQNIVERAKAPEIAELLRRFATHAEGGIWASHELFHQELLRDFGDDLMILRPSGDGDYIYLHCGRAIVRNLGTNRTGQRVSQMPPQLARFSIETYEHALGSGSPLYTVHRSLKTARVSLWERLVLPTRTDAGQRFLLIFACPLQFREELLTTVLETSPCGIVALRAVRDYDGHIERMVIITANRRAALIVGEDDERLLDADARGSLPFLAEPSLWQRCLHVVGLRRNDMFEASFAMNGNEIWLKLALAPLGDGLVMSLTDITELMIANLTLQSRAATLALEIGRERATRRALSHEIGQREERERELRRLAETDPLTALLNRRSFTEKANAEIAACEADGKDASLIIVDLDHFKSVNDNHGHAAGDAVIRAFADLLLGRVRPERDLVGRFGGEEFAVFLPRTSAAGALKVARRIQDALASRQLPVSETSALQVTASLGIATRRSGESLADFIARADTALYRAKHEGRNCVRLAGAEVAVAA